MPIIENTKLFTGSYISFRNTEHFFSTLFVFNIWFTGRIYKRNWA